MSKRATNRNLELKYLDTKRDNEMWITIDSGHLRTSLDRRWCLSARSFFRAGSVMGVSFLAANGTVMPNVGEKRVQAYTSDGGKCELRMQVTDMRKPLCACQRSAMLVAK